MIPLIRWETSKFVACHELVILYILDLSRNGIVISLLCYAGKEVVGSSGYEFLSFTTLDDFYYIFEVCHGLENVKAIEFHLVLDIGFHCLGSCQLVVTHQM